MTTNALENRRSLLRLIERFPGIHLRELARTAGMSEALAAYHLEALVEDELARAVTEGGFRRFYAVTGPAPTAEDETLLRVLRKPVPFQIALMLLDGPATHGQLTDRLGLAKSTVSYHLAQLRSVGLVEQHAHETLALAHPRRVRRVLVRWRPVPDLTDRFADLWGTFFGHTRRPPR